MHKTNPSIRPIREEVLDEASSLISGERDMVYGHPKHNFRRTARLYEIYMNGRTHQDETDIAIFNILQKVARLSNDRTHHDSWVDIAGYAAIGAELEGLKVLGSVDRPDPNVNGDYDPTVRETDDFNPAPFRER